MKKVYIVTAGEYSAYRICAVCSTREKADKYIRDKVGEKIELWDIDSFDEILNFLDHGYGMYYVEMKKNGDVIKVSKYSEKEYEYEYWELDEISFIDTDLGEHGGYCEKYDAICIRIVAKDEQHAIKIANEKRSYLIANNEWKKIEKEDE